MPICRESDSYVLHLKKLSFQLKYCFGCGYDISTKRHIENAQDFLESQPCSCQQVLEWSKDEDIPIKYDEDLGYFILYVEGGGAQQIRYCPSCGGWLLKSKAH
jgi:hypothetical protein